MPRYSRLYWVPLIILYIASCWVLSKQPLLLFPPISTSLSTEMTRLEDFTGIALGWRRLAADLAWIQTLQYYGTPEEGQSEQEFENGIGRYPQFLAYCQRVTRIDPYFTYAYLYGSGVLGWNLSRLTEAETLLKEGIANNPKEWRLHQYLAALAYQKNHNMTYLETFLEGMVKDPECPHVLKSILANLYKKTHQYENAIQIWIDLYQSGDPAYSVVALRQIHTLQQLSTLDKK